MSQTGPQAALTACGVAINEVAYDEAHTESLTNHAHRMPDDLRPAAESAIQRMRRAGALYLGQSTREDFKHAFGPQQRTVTYRLRNWVWTFSRAGTTIWALVSTEGRAWEWDPRGNAYEAFRIRRDVEDALIGK